MNSKQIKRIGVEMKNKIYNQFQQKKKIKKNENLNTGINIGIKKLKNKGLNET